MINAGNLVDDGFQRPDDLSLHLVGLAPGSTACTAAAGMEICGFSSRGVESTAQIPKIKAAIIRTSVSLHLNKPARQLPGQRVPRIHC